jgi:hypothetical protein
MGNIYKRSVDSNLKGYGHELFHITWPSSVETDRNKKAIDMLIK